MKKIALLVPIVPSTVLLSGCGTSKADLQKATASGVALASQDAKVTADAKAAADAKVAVEAKAAADAKAVADAQTAAVAAQKAAADAQAKAPTYVYVQPPSYEPPIVLRPEVGGSADGMPYWSVIVASDSGQAAAEASAASLRAHGFTDAFVVYSSDVPSLNSGYWVAASGKYSHRDDASAASLRAKDAGFSEAYPRCFGSSDTACGS